MKNKEKYAKEIIEIASLGHIIAVDRGGKPYDCAGINCDECILHQDNQGICNKSRKEWFESEAKKTLIEILNEEIEKIEKIRRESGRINSKYVVDILKQIRIAARQEGKK